MKYKIITLVVGIIFITTNYWLGCESIDLKKDYSIDSDPAGYYQYLPALFIKHDIRKQFGYPVENGYELNKYNCGVAILEAPVFYLQYKYTQIKKIEEKIGSSYYGKGILLSGIIYLFFGLRMLFCFLKEKFGNYSALTSTALIYLGTNLYFYTIFQPGMSHVFSFFCFCGVLFYTDKSYRTNNISDHVINAVFIALVLLIRPINAPVIVFFVFYNIYSFEDLKNRVAFFLKEIHILFIYIIAVAILYIPQIVYWKILTGNYVIYSYGYNNESFIYWSSPKIFDVLFGVQCGWLPYTPVMFFAVVGLFIIAFKKIHNGISIGLTMGFILYICASWWCNFSCAFGYRSFVEYYPLLAVPLTYFINEYLTKRGFIISMAFILLFVFFNLKITHYLVWYLWSLCQPDWAWDKYFAILKDVFFKAN